MSQRFKRKFIWSAALGFLLWSTGFYLYRFALKYSITEADVQRFETAYKEKCAELEKNLQTLLTGVETRESAQDQFEFAQNFALKTHTDYFIYTLDTLSLWTTNSIPLSNI